MVCPKCGTTHHYNEPRCRSCYHLLSHPPVADRPAERIFQPPLRQPGEPILKTTGIPPHVSFARDNFSADNQPVDDTTSPNLSIELPFRKREDVEVVTAMSRPGPGIITANTLIFIGLSLVLIFGCAAAFVYYSTARAARAHTMFVEAEKVFASGNYRTAQALYQQFITHYPEDELALTARQRIDAIRNRFEKQKRGQQIRQIQAWLDLARQAFTKKRYTLPEHDNVILHTGRILEIDPTHPEALALQAKVVQYYQGRAELSFTRRQYRSAHRYYSKILEILPSDATARARLQEIAGKGVR